MSCGRGKALTLIFAPLLIAAICPLRAQEATAWADFQQKAAAWRALPVKPALSEDVRREGLLAENAVSEKRFASAAEHYEAGLKINPLWPEGHFNAALIDAELKNYADAVWHMRAYVELAPKAPDAPGARDQIAIWQDKLIWTDPVTGLKWIRQDNRSDVTWNQAKDYCASLTLDGYSNWRLPTIDELAAIYDTTNDSVDERRNLHYHIKGGIELSMAETWSGTTGRKSGEASYFSFYTGSRSQAPGRIAGGRALCVHGFRQ
jgi:tetratricopeptide (TPR) repeat protein